MKAKAKRKSKKRHKKSAEWLKKADYSKKRIDYNNDITLDDLETIDFNNHTQMTDLTGIDKIDLKKTSATQQAAKKIKKIEI